MCTELIPTQYAILRKYNFTLDTHCVHIILIQFLEHSKFHHVIECYLTSHRKCMSGQKCDFLTNYYDRLVLPHYLVTQDVNALS